MKKTLIKVPKGIQYMSDWNEYELPRGNHFIVDKGVTGCGYTEFCLRNSDNIVLCSPRKLLLENKRDQHLQDLNILYAENKVDGYSEALTMESKIRDHIQNCLGPYQKPCKLMVTYDSTKYVVKVLKEMNLLNEFIFVSDEFQAMFRDSQFKSEVELGFVDVLQDCPNVIYLSATPMLEKYLERIPEFKDLEYQVLDWSETGYIENIFIQRKNVHDLNKKCREIILDYLGGRFPISLDQSGNPIESKEAVFYLNSVTDIIKIIKKIGLTPENTLIICSDQESNRKKLKKIGFELGRIPLEDEPNPMFIFCTSATYMGVDMYSKCASTFVFADPNIKSLILDVSQDLAQIVGRQRDKSNPFKNNIVIFYKTQRNPITREEFLAVQKERKFATTEILDGFLRLTESQRTQYLIKLKRDIERSRYSTDFVSISKTTGQPVYNYFVELANERAWEVAQEDYQDQISVTKALEDLGYTVGQYMSEADLILTEFLKDKFFATGFFHEKLKVYCEFRDLYSGYTELLNSLEFKIRDPRFKTYYDFYGTSGCKSKEYREKDLMLGMRDSTKDADLTKKIIQFFKVGDRYPVSDIKIKLNEFNKDLGILRKAKATDLENYFTLIRTSITLPDRTVVNGFKLGPKI